MQARERLIVALDVDDIREAEKLIGLLAPEVEIFKVGIAPFTSFGEEVLDRLASEGKRCFLDLKVHDIPNTAARAAKAAAEKKVFMMNFHCLGGKKMMEAAAAANREKGGPILLGVTVLTSMGPEDMKDLGMSGETGDKVLDLARSARDSGLDGVVASPEEAGRIKSTIGKDFLVVTPGVRPLWASRDDQKRVKTPGEAIAEGADYIVVGRPVIKSDDPLNAATRIIKEIERAQ